MLNEPLYNVLYNLFNGKVSIANEDVEGHISYTELNGKLYANVSGSSQEFKVNCPVCGDKRGRLYISYIMCADIKRGGKQALTYSQMHCHNENCNNIELYKRIKQMIKNPQKITITKRTQQRNNLLAPPGKSVPINSDKAPEAAKLYLTNRGFDLNELATKYNVLACERLEGAEHLGNMIIFPSYNGDTLDFWQARMCYDPPKESKMPKYYFPPNSNKSLCVYNRFNAIGKDTVVITEGVLDALRIGDEGVAIFGKCPSVAQTRIISRVFKRKRGVLLLDGDAHKEAEAWHTKYKDVLFEKGMALCKLPDDMDPASYTREEIWDIINNCIKEQLDG